MHVPCQVSLPSTPPRRPTASSSCASPSSHSKLRICTAPRRQDPSPSVCRMKHRSTKESVLWSLDHVCTSKNDAPKGGTTPERRNHPIIRSRVSPEVAESGLELLHGDAFKKGTTQIALPPPALAEAQGKFSPRSVRRDPTLVPGPPPPPAPLGRTLEHRQISEPPAPP